MEIIEKNIFIIGIFFWFWIALLSTKNININKHKIIYIAYIIPTISLLYNHFHNKKINIDKEYNDIDYMKWLFDRIHNNSLYIATGVFAIGLLTEPRMGKKFKEIIPFYVLTIFFGVGLNLSIFFTTTKHEDIFFSKLKTIFLSYGIGTMMIGMLYTLSLFNSKKI